MSTATDLFAGAGGSSQGLHAAGFTVEMAANHWRLAVDSHAANFRDTAHDCADLSQVKPQRYPRTALLWGSPECTNHSIAKSSNRQQADRTPNAEGEVLPDDASERSRATMWDIVRFAEHHRYPVVIVENVVDAVTWVLYDAWVASMRALGYEHQEVFLNSMFAGAPQSRDRYYGVFWMRGVKAPDLNIHPAAYCEPCGREVASVQTFKPGHARAARYNAQNYNSCPGCANRVEPNVHGAETAIDWTIPGQVIGQRSKPLADGTMRRIQAGLD